MATTLLVIIYVAFIGLGIPDSLLGAAWPAIYPELGLPVSAAGGLSLLLSACTVVSSLCSSRLIDRFGAGLVTAVSTALTAVGLLGYSLSSGAAWLVLSTLPLGLGAGAIDTCLNNYVALHYKASHMNFLHCFYGVGVSLSPWVLSRALAAGAGWRVGYRAACIIQTVLTAALLCSLPLWARQPQKEAAAKKGGRSSGLALARRADVWAVWIFFFCYCGIEFVCGTWGSTFLVSTRGLSAETAAGTITFFYAGMAVGRFVSGLLAGRLSPWRLIYLGCAGMLAALAVLTLPLPAAAYGAVLFVLGFGLGPIYPNLLHLTPRNFGAELSQAVMGSQMAAAYIGILALPPLFGFFGQRFGMGLFVWFQLGFYALMLGALLMLTRLLKRAGRFGPAAEGTV